MDAGARRTAPWTARFDGFVVHRKPKSIISYRILVAKRSESGSAHVLNTLPQRKVRKPGNDGAYTHFSRSA